MPTEEFKQCLTDILKRVLEICHSKKQDLVVELGHVFERTSSGVGITDTITDESGEVHTVGKNSSLRQIVKVLGSVLHQVSSLRILNWHPLT